MSILSSKLLVHLSIILCAALCYWDCSVCPIESFPGKASEIQHNRAKQNLERLVINNAIVA